MASPTEPSQPRSTGAFRSRNFRLYQTARLLVILGAEAQSVAVAWQVYQITHSALDLGYTGLALFLPGLFCMLAAGHIADRYNRKNIILACYALQLVCTFGLLYIALTGRFISGGHVWPIYAVLVGIGLGRAFSGPASSALLPSLVPKEDFVNAVTWGATVYQTANILGPAVGGLLFTFQFAGAMQRWTGAPIVYLFTLLMLTTFLVLIAMLRPSFEHMEKKAFSLRTMLAGLEYVWRTKLLLGSISLDLFAVLLGGAVALLPIFATEILHAGPQGLGILRATPSLGALVVSLVLTVRPIKHSAGKIMLVCVAIFGSATVVFGLSRSIWLSLLALVAIGASDMISVVIRSSILQLATPPEMRGRVSAVNWLFIGASNEFGEFESGLTAHWFGAVRAVVLGGIGSLMVTGATAAFFPALRHADALTAESLRAAETALSEAEPVD
ncbi:Transmembrane secretion effector [Granulicella rosea]|uniref:Transmembrane secretion effector n=1 Tax=Granulicella rosea TaxID=474952 RepID=A0A239CY62_9BACT|nr:MFS transporter [Granulicella rosea]SNS24879.1 Transmembrane secretion effector [Granulicella rosea]